MAFPNFASYKPKTMNEQEAQFSKILFNELEIIRLIEDSYLKRLALRYIPIDELTMEATRRLSLMDDESSFEDCLVVELLQWFKLTFFSWVDKPACETCGNITESTGKVAPLSEELSWWATTVEQYYCKACNLYIRFPRYQHPQKLLETKKGRCGEWAKCFVLLLRALDYESRLVVDWTDHVWVEFFSTFKERWVHCDPCENMYDQPLMYEMGWKKELTFIIAFSKDEVQDVTWRYTCNFEGVLQRRKATNCSETFVLDCLNYYTKCCQAERLSAEIEILQKRQLFELAELISPPKIPKGNLSGRTSGSRAWRLERGELGVENLHIPYVFKLCERERHFKHFHLQYSCAMNEYIRVTDESVKFEHWRSLTFEAKNIFRKIETDWKMAYLSRTEGSPIGLIKWKFDFEDSELVIRQLRIKLQCATFENGEVKWYFLTVKKSGKTFEKVFSGQALELVLDDEPFKGAIGFTLTAELSAGKGMQAWQHAQIFRQSLTDTNFPFDIKIFFDKYKT